MYADHLNTNKCSMAPTNQSYINLVHRYDVKRTRAKVPTSASRFVTHRRRMTSDSARITNRQ